MPSPPVLSLCVQLSHIYDTAINHPMLAVFRLRGPDEELVEVLDSLYDAVMTLPTRYREWMRAMKRVGDDFTKPTMHRILASEHVMATILEHQAQRKSAAESTSTLELARSATGTNQSVRSTAELRTANGSIRLQRDRGRFAASTGHFCSTVKKKFCFSADPDRVDPDPEGEM